VREQILEATIGMTAELEPGLAWFASLYAPLTVYGSEVDADFYPVDTMLTAEVEAPALKMNFRGVGAMSLRGRVV
jgi:hypothetical protein